MEKDTPPFSLVEDWISQPIHGLPQLLLCSAQPAQPYAWGPGGRQFMLLFQLTNLGEIVSVLWGLSFLIGKKRREVGSENP